ncbi:MAG: 2-C-methyl-D-erythritol 4-phosphate cytidylyltransferase [Gammaproteobacteria bacterium]|nr:2-C-methyl-D-erythritol 4-phosphate cytidylyltransferase [Gammaproteobacteria bacterium]
MPDSPTQPIPTKDNYWALVPAAGIGKRLGAKTPKQYLKLHGTEVLAWTLQTLSQLDFLEKIVLVLHPDDDYFSINLAKDFPNVLVVSGGQERQDSVAYGLEFLQTLAKDEDWVFVHDAARPCLTKDDMNKLRSVLENNETGGILASRVKDTLKHSDEALNITSTLDRDEYWLAATPQLFRFRVLLDAFDKLKESGQRATDEAAAVEALGLPVRIVEGRSDNIKITSQEDLALAEFILKQLGKVNA